ARVRACGYTMIRASSIPPQNPGNSLEMLAGLPGKFEARAMGKGSAGVQSGAPPTFTRIINPVFWEGVPIPERQWIVPDYIPAEVVTMLSGDGGLGKSLLALQLAVGRALAKEWIGLLPEPGKTLILSAEDDANEMHRRLDAVRKFYNAKFSEFGDIRLIDLVGDDPLLASLTRGKI